LSSCDWPHNRVDIYTTTCRKHKERARTGSSSLWRGGNWQISISLGKLYQGQRRHKEAEQAFAAARTIIEELATTIEDESLRENFMRQATGMLPPTRSLTPARAMKQAFGGLSKREREVAVLIAQGKSNREIADMLVLSERTIESHVSSILFKLDCTSRTQIVTWTIEKGLTRELA